jgi:hypothetical protein
VLALTCENAQLDALVVEHGGWVAPTRDVQAASRAMGTALHSWRENSLADVETPPVTVGDAVGAILQAVKAGGVNSDPH